MKPRYLVLWLVMIAILILVNWSIFDKEQLLAGGEPVFLELAPVDPRSLIQGDYMALRYEIARQLEQQKDLPREGYVVLSLAENKVASLARIYDDETPLAENERLLRYHKWGNEVYLGPESFFFEEGQSEAYNQARYGELRLDESGQSLLIDLRGPNLERLGISNPQK